MTEAADKTASARWRSEGSGLIIETNWDLLSAIDRDVIAGFQQISHGGIEVGGLVFGVKVDDTIRILAFRAVPCSYAAGPRYKLSAEDEARFAEMLKAPASDADLRGMIPVGWYHSHTRSEIGISEDDLALYNRNFPEAWQVALVLRPKPFVPTRAAWFFRDSGGAVKPPEAEFVIPKPAIQEVPLPRHEEPAAPSVAGATGEQPAGTIRVEPAVVPRGRGTLLWACIATGLLLTALPLLYRSLLSVRESSAVSLRVSDRSGQLHIEWNRHAPPVLEAARGYLEIDDVGNPLRIHLDQRQLRDGSVVYSRFSPTVQVRMVLERPGAPAVEESTHFLGPPVPLPENAFSVPPLPSPGAALETVVPPRIPELPPDPASKADRLQGEAGRTSPPADNDRTPVQPRQFRPVLARNTAPAVPMVDAPPVVTRQHPDIRPVPPVLAQRALPPVAPPPRPAAPLSKRIIWTGKLERRGVVEIEGDRGSIGHLSAPLPGGPGAISVMPGEMTSRGLRLYTSNARLANRPEQPGPENGWNATEYVWDPERAREISVLEAPGPQNDWNRLVLRSERRTYALVVLRWEALPGGR